EHPEFVPPHSFGLVGAHWWDVVILGLSVALLILILAKLLRPRRTNMCTIALTISLLLLGPNGCQQKKGPAGHSQGGKEEGSGLRFAILLDRCWSGRLEFA